MFTQLRAMIAASAALLPAMLVAQSDIRTEQVHFEPGTTGTTIEASITGDDIVDYVLRASAGQTMNVSMSTNNLSNYFNVLAPGENEAAIFTGSVGENQYEGELPTSGEYKVRVYLMRNAARRNETAKYRLEINIAAATADRDSFDATVAGSNYHATGLIPCAQGSGQPMGNCEFGVRRQGNGSGIVTVTRPDNTTLFIVFEDGKIISAGGDESFDESHDGASFDVSRDGDLNSLTIGDERYEIPDAVIYGG